MSLYYAKVKIRFFEADVRVYPQYNMTTIQKDFAITLGLEIYPWKKCVITTEEGDVLDVIGVVVAEFIVKDKSYRTFEKIMAPVPVVDRLFSWFVIGQDTIRSVGGTVNEEIWSFAVG